jgi:cysteinyl-tRNA synthetase
LAGAAAGLASLRAAVAALGPAPTDGPWAASAPLRAGAAPSRPEGTASGIAGNGDGSGPELRDRAHAPAAPLSRAGRALHDRFVAALDDDLDLPTALAVLRETLRSDLPTDECRWLALDADFVLGLDLDRTSGPDVSSEVPAAIADLVAERAAARQARDFARADEIRDELARLGWELIDTTAGSEVHRIR